jgi:hypothetical protein
MSDDTRPRTRRLTARHQAQVTALEQTFRDAHNSVEARNLDRIWLDGTFHLDDLRRLVELLTTCERELDAAVLPTTREQQDGQHDHQDQDNP